MLLFTPLLTWAGRYVYKRFTLFKGERLNPKIEGDIHITKFTIKCLERDLKP